MTPRAAHSEDVGLGGALGLMVLALALILLLGGLFAPLGLGGLVLVELLCFALPAWVTARVAGAPRRVLALAWPRARVLAGAALVGVSFWFLDVTVFGRLSERWMSPTEAHRLTDPIVGPTPLGLKLVVLALFPAVCEELLVRGAVARGLRPRLGLVGAALVSAAYFALLHGSVARALPVGVFGVVLAVIALRAESTAASTLTHCLNNAAVVVVAQPALAGVGQALADHEIAAGLMAGALSAAGMALLWPRRVRRRDPA